jgi:hypothetical protein
MSVLKLVPYEINIHPHNKAGEDNLWNLADLNEHNAQYQAKLGEENPRQGQVTADDFSDLFSTFCEDLQKDVEDLGERDAGPENTTFAFSDDWRFSEKFVEGYLYIGNYGVIRNLLDKESGERREEARSMGDSEEKPLYFLVYTPPQDSKKAYVILERSPNYGAKSSLEPAFRKWFRNNYSNDLRVEINPKKTDEIFDRVESADRAVRLRLEKEGHPADKHDAFESVFDKDRMRQALEYTPERGEDMELVIEELKEWHEDSERSFESIDDEEYTKVKLTIENNDSEETISLTKGEVTMRRNISLDDVSGEGDVPRLKEISSRAHGFLSTIHEGYDGSGSLFK